MTDWLIDAADLLAEPDPGPTPWLAENLIVDQALTAVVGRWKTTKSWACLEIAVSIGTGLPAFGTVEIPQPGSVVYVVEESGRRALWRRLDMLCRGRAIDPDALRGRLLLAPNQRVKLDDPDWQAMPRSATGVHLRPACTDEASEPRGERADRDGPPDRVPPLAARQDGGGAAVRSPPRAPGEHMRGSSDLESVWESRLTFARDGDNGIVTVTASHREEEDGFALSYRLDSHRETRTLRLRSAVPPLAERIIDHLREHGPMGVEELAKGIETRSSDVRQTLARLEALGTTHRAPSGKRDGLGRVISAKVWHLSNQARLRPVPEPGRHGTAHTDSVLPPAPRPVPLGTDGGRGTDPDALRDPVDAPQPRLRPGAPGFLHELSLAREAGHVSEGEWEQLSWLHRRAKRAT